MLVLLAGLPARAQEAPRDPLAGRSAGGHTLQLSQMADQFQSLGGISLDEAYSAQAFSRLYLANYEIVRDMQEQAAQADQIYRRSPQQDLLYEANVLVHAYMAVASARVQDVVAYEKHMEIAFKRVRDQQNLTGDQIRTAFCTVLQTNAPQLLQDFNRWAVGGTCPDASLAADESERPIRPAPQASPFEDYRAAAAGPVRLVFDPGPSRALLKHFAVRVADPDSASPQSMIFANWLTQHLRDPIVSNWPLDHFLSQWFPGWKPSRRDSYWVGGTSAPQASPSSQPQDRVELPPVYLRSDSIQIQAEDYFAADPSDAFKTDLFREMWSRINQGRERIPLEVGIPEGEYYFLPCNVDEGCDYITELDRQSGPNLVVDRDQRLQPTGYEVYMSASLNSIRVVPTGVQPSDTWTKVFQPDFRLLRFDVGSDDQNSNIQGSVELRTFHRLTKAFAIQTQLEGAFRSHHDTNDLAEFLPDFVPRAQRGFGDFGTRELQFDIGPVVRFRNYQFAVMQSLRRVDRSGWDRSGTLGQFFFNFSYLFERGQVGAFLTDGNQDNVVVRTVPITPVEFEETFLAVTDQIGVNFDVYLARGVSVEGSFGYLESELNDNAPGGVVRVNLPPFFGRLKITGEFGINESFVSQENSWRFGFGVRLGEWGRSNSPRNYLADQGPVPVFVPRLRYETLTRTVRGDNRAPIADAGPDMPDVDPFTRVILDGTNSSDPDDDPLTFAWELLDDCPPTIILEDEDQAVASFVIGNGETCSAKLTVTDTGGLSDMDVKQVSSARVEQPIVVEFTADPSEIRTGESSTLTYRVENAEMVTITNVPDSSLPSDEGSVVVMPDETTTYALTACNRVNECATAEATVLVRPDFPRIVSFTTEDSDIRMGESTVICWETEGATLVTLTNDGNPEEVARDGCLVVTPEETTTYTLTATNERGESVQASLTVTVRPSDLVQIVFFRANPVELRGGGEVFLTWDTEGATRVFITEVGRVAVDSEPGGIPVDVNETTTFNMTASNEEGEFSEAEVTVLVRDLLPRIESFNANPSPAIIGGGQGGNGDCSPDTALTRLSWQTQNATIVQLTTPEGNTEDVAPSATDVSFCLERTSTFVLRAINADGEDVSTSLTVPVIDAAPVINSFRIASASPPPRITDSPVVRDAPGVFVPNTELTLAWETNFREGWTLTIGNADGVVPGPSGMVTVILMQDTTYTLVLTNTSGEQATASISAQTDLRPRITSFTVTPDGLFPSTTVRTLTWSIQGAARAEIRSSMGPDIGSVPTSGSVQVTVPVNTTFTLIAFSSKGLVEAERRRVEVSN